MANDETDVEVRVAKKLAQIIQAAKPKAKVFHWWVIGQGPIGESFPDVQSELEDEWGATYIPWPHAYVIGYDQASRQKKAINTAFRDIETYRLWGFYGFMKGDENKNSADIARIHWKEVQNAITKATKMQQTSDPNGVPEAEQHGEWQIEKMGIYWMGTVPVHIAQGELAVSSRIILNPMPIGV